MPRVRPDLRVTPGAMPVAHALAASAALSRLAERMRASDACLAAVQPSVPAALAGALRAGPYDEAGWSILAANASVAAKLRHLLPRFERDLADAGLTVAAIRIKVA